jgi:hypothetical protein
MIGERLLYKLPKPSCAREILYFNLSNPRCIAKLTWLIELLKKIQIKYIYSILVNRTIKTIKKLKTWFLATLIVSDGCPSYTSAIKYVLPT